MWKGQRLDKLLEYVGAGTGMLGSVLVAAGFVAGFYVWLISNAAWLALFHRKAMRPSMVMQAFYACTAVQGIIMWGPRA